MSRLNMIEALAASKPSEKNSGSSQSKKVPTIYKDDFKSLEDEALQNYLKTIPRNEWVKIVKFLLMGYGVGALSGLTFVMGRYIQWLKETKNEKGVKATTSDFSSRAGASVGRAAAEAIRTPKDVWDTMRRTGKGISTGAKAAWDIIRRGKSKTTLEKIKDFGASLKNFKFSR